MQAFRRDGGHREPRDARTCPASGSARVPHNAELRDLAIIHLDRDAIQAVIGKRDRLQSRDVPMIGGARHRSVVAVSRYAGRRLEARSPRQRRRPGHTLADG